MADQRSLEDYIANLQYHLRETRTVLRDFKQACIDDAFDHHPGNTAMIFVIDTQVDALQQQVGLLEQDNKGY